MALLSYGLSRNVPIVAEDGTETLGCLVAIQHQNGHRERMIIREDRIAHYGEGIIEQEVKRYVSR